jgi:hypothetical protein
VDPHLLFVEYIAKINVSKNDINIEKNTSIWKVSFVREAIILKY